MLALSLTASVPVAVPVCVGEKVTLIVQLLWLSSVVPQVVDEIENGPVVEYEMPVRVVGKLFLRLKLCAALVSPIFVSGKLYVAGVKVACATPVPDSDTACGLPAALSVKLRVPVAAPNSVGVKVTFTSHAWPASSVATQVLLGIAKLLPSVIAMLLISSVAVPVFDRVTVLAALEVLTA